MAQHDYNIANQGFPQTRSDINNALAAIMSNNSGTTAPTTTTAFMWWYDSTNNILKMRNAANTAWIDIGLFDQAAARFEPIVREIRAADTNGISLQNSSSVTQVVMDDSGRVGIGSAASAAASLEVNSTTRGFRAPRMTTAQKNAIASPGAGLLVYDTDLAAYSFHNGASWQSLGGGAVSGLTLSNFSAATVVTAAEGIGANNNDTTFPTCAAVIAYVTSGGTAAYLNTTALVGGTSFIVPLEGGITNQNWSLAGSGSTTIQLVDVFPKFRVLKGGTIQFGATVSRVGANTGSNFVVAVNGTNVFTSTANGAISTGNITVAAGDIITFPSTWSYSAGSGGASGSITFGSLEARFASDPGLFRY